MTGAATEERARADSAPAPLDDARSVRLAFFVFIAIALVAVPVLLYLGRRRWFVFDEWDFLASRSATSWHDLFEPHSVHWSTIPILYYRALWAVFGIRSYLPYQAGAVFVHLVVVGLTRATMRRAGVRPWTATAAVLPLVFLGSGDDNILWAFGITFTASLAFGLTQLLLADHDGAIDRRDYWGLLAGLLGLLCSGVAVTMVIVVGIATLVRRGPRVAVFHVLPLAAVYGLWFFAIGRTGLRFERKHSITPSDVVSFLRISGADAFARITQAPGLGWGLAALIAAGCFLAWHGRPYSELRRVAAAPFALLIGAFVFLFIAALGRGTELAGATRYTHVVAILMFPAVAIAADAIMLRWRVTALVFGVVLVVATVGNVREFDNAAHQRADDFQRAYKQNFFLMPRLPLAKQVPPSVHPLVGLAPWVTLGWMERGVASGRIPEPAPSSPEAAASLELTLALRTPVGRAPTNCSPMGTSAHVRLKVGSSLKLGGPTTLVYTNSDGTQSVPYKLSPLGGSPYLMAFAGPLDLSVRSNAKNQPFAVCQEDGGPVVVPPGP